MNTSQVSHHADIPKTILDFVEVGDEKLPLTGRSLFRDGQGVAVYRDNAQFGLLSDKNLYTLTDGEGNISTYDWETGTTHDTKSDEAKRLRAYLQYYFNGLISNSLAP